MVRAKFKVDSIARVLNSGHYVDNKWVSEPVEVRTVIMSPVTGSSPEDKSFWDATPSGRLEMQLINLEAAEQFDLGKTYYLDFIPVEGD